MAVSGLMDALDRHANEVFGGRVVRKDLVRQVKIGANVPVYVLEFLLGKYCASDDPAAIETGLEVVRQTLTENFIRPDEAEKAKAALKRKGQHRLIDKVDVRLLASENKFWATLANFGDKFVHIPEDVVYRYERLLQGGVWSQVDLLYEAADDELHQRPFYIQALKPIQVATFSMKEYVDGRARFDRDEWLDLLMRSIGLEPSEYDHRGKLVAVLRLVPMVERNYNLIELGPWGTGKSYVYRETSPNAILISGGKVTVPQLFVNLNTGRVGLVGTWDVVAFDEVAGIQYSDATAVQMLKDYMESSSFARGKDVIPAEASIVFIGNTSKPTQDLVRSAHLFADLPKAMIDPAFLDRLHFFLPGWEAPKLEQRLFTDHYGFVSDYLAEAIRELRKRSDVRAIDGEFALGAHLSARDERAVRKTVSGLLKLLHPDGEWTRAELREYLELALEGRRRVKEQLKKLAAHDYAKTSFSYVERDTSREYWVDVPEQPEEVASELQAEAQPTARTPHGEHPLRERSTAELLGAGESSSLEFKSNARWNEHTRQRDSAIELAVVKTVAGFMNAHGGTLLVGVGDHGQVVGLDHDLKTLGRRDHDGYENWLTTLFETSIGNPQSATCLSASRRWTAELFAALTCGHQASPSLSGRERATLTSMSG
ncbi:MAG TPA: protease Lon-related BREX system protein BrxL [Actinomycetes bacterium]|jgi:ATP-dependent Lon protease|nr:protease Lon-related BREX system protein BrxL [Actinomycetes bacterium]